MINGKNFRSCSNWSVDVKEMTVIGHTKFESIPELNSVLKLKKDVLIATLSNEFCQEHKINPENLKFDILKDSKNKIWFAQVEQSTDNLTPTKMEITNVK